MTYPQKYKQDCPTCGRRLSIQTRYLGLKMTCQHCHGTFVARDPSSIWDVEANASVENVLSKLQNNLEKSGILDKSGVLIQGAK